MKQTLRRLTLFVSLITVGIACTRSEVAFPTQQEAVATQAPTSQLPQDVVQPTSTVETGEEPGAPYPTDTLEFILGAGGSQEEIFATLRALAPLDVEREIALYQTEIERSGMNLRNFEFVPNLLLGCSWVIVPRNTQTSNFWVPALTNPDDTFRIIASLHLFDYLNRDITDDFFTLVEVEMLGTQQLVADESCWHVIAGFDENGEVVSWYAANFDEVRELPRGAASRIQAELAAIGVETELSQLGNGDLVLTHTDSRGTKEIGKFRQIEGELVFEVVKENGKKASFPVDQLMVDPETGYLTIVEQGETLFAYIHQIQRLDQYADLPYLTETVGRLTIVIGDSFDRIDGYGFRSLTIGYRDTSTPGLDPMLIREFRDPGTGQTVELDSEGRLSLATEIAQVIAAQAWDPNYTFADLREGKPHQIRTLDGTMHEVDPTKGMTFQLVGSQPPEEYYSYQFITWPMKFWWDVAIDGTLRVYCSTDPRDPGAGYGGNIDVLFRYAFQTMMFHQYVEGIERVSIFYEGYGRLLNNSASRELSKLFVNLINEIDQDKMADARRAARGQDIGLEPGVVFNIDLLWAER